MQAFVTPITSGTHLCVVTLHQPVRRTRWWYQQNSKHQSNKIRVVETVLHLQPQRHKTRPMQLIFPRCWNLKLKPKECSTQNGHATPPAPRAGCPSWYVPGRYGGYVRDPPPFSTRLYARTGTHTHTVQYSRITVGKSERYPGAGRCE